MNSDPHLWEIRWVRDLAVLTLVVLVLWTAYLTRGVTVPILIGLVLAYAFNPLITWSNERCWLPRWAGAAIIMVIVVVAFVGFGFWALPLLINQINELLGNLTAYLKYGGAQLGIADDLSVLIQQIQNTALANPLAKPDGTTTQPAPAEFVKPAAQAIMLTYQFIKSILLAIVNFVTYVPIAAVIIAFCFFFFSWHWTAIIGWFGQFIPYSSRDTTNDVVGKMDRSVAAFIRGRLIQALVMGVILSVGWGLFDVPYWLLLGMGCGMLNLVPFLAVVGWMAATGLAVIDRLSGSGDMTIWIIVWPTVVYILTQLLDGWVIEPIVQGKATNLDPLTVLLAVLIGGSLAGLLGMLLAIPTAACIKILGQEVMVPRLRDYVRKTG